MDIYHCQLGGIERGDELGERGEGGQRTNEK